MTDPLIYLSETHTLDLSHDRWRKQGFRAYVAGISGSGKTNLVAVFCEELHGLGVPFLVIDPMDDYRSLRELGRGVRLVSERGGDIELTHPRHEWVDVTMESLKQGYSLVVDLKSIFDSSEKRRAYTLILSALLRHQQQAREPMFLVLEEAHIFCPQKRQQDLAALDITAEIARQGRRSGINLILASQRPRDLEADVASQCNIHFCGKLEAWLDYEAIKHSLYVPDTSSVHNGKPPRGLVTTTVTKTPQLHNLSELETGQFYVRLGAKLNLIRVRQRNTTHIGATPEIRVKQRRMFEGEDN